MKMHKNVCKVRAEKRFFLSFRKFVVVVEQTFYEKAY